MFRLQGRTTADNPDDPTRPFDVWVPALELFGAAPGRDPIDVFIDQDLFNTQPEAEAQREYLIGLRFTAEALRVVEEV